MPNSAQFIGRIASRSRNWRLKIETGFSKHRHTSNRFQKLPCPASIFPTWRRIPRALRILICMWIRGNLNLSSEEFPETLTTGNLPEHRIDVNRPRFQLDRSKAAIAIRSTTPRNQHSAHSAEAPTFFHLIDSIGCYLEQHPPGLSFTLCRNNFSVMHCFGFELLLSKPSHAWQLYLEWLLHGPPDSCPNGASPRVKWGWSGGEGHGS